MIATQGHQDQSIRIHKSEISIDLLSWYSNVYTKVYLNLDCYQKRAR